MTHIHAMTRLLVTALLFFACATPAQATQIATPTPPGPDAITVDFGSVSHLLEIANAINAYVGQDGAHTHAYVNADKFRTYADGTTHYKVVVRFSYHQNVKWIIYHVAFTTERWWIVSSAVRTARPAWSY